MASSLAERLYEKYQQQQHVRQGDTVEVRDGDTILTAKPVGATTEIRSGRLVQAPYVLIAGKVEIGSWSTAHFEYTPHYWTKEIFMDIACGVLDVLDEQRSRFVGQMLGELGP